MDTIAQDETHIAEYIGGFLFITEKESGKDHLVRLTNSRGNCITRGQFKDAIKTHGFARACETFKKLAANKES